MMRKLRTILFRLWAVLWVCSALVWWYRAEHRAPVSEMDFRDLIEVQEGDVLGKDPVKIAFHDVAGESGNRPVVLVLHGSPVASSAMMPLVRELKGKFRLLIPDLPGMGASERGIPDYSFQAHAEYVNQLLAQLNIDRVHVVAYSMGGGVALHLARDHPERVASMVMVSAIGVQEYEIFGNYSMNHALHWLQWAGLSVFRWTVPHFGFFDDQPLNVSYARNFLDSDQRPLREILAGYSKPMLIQHGSGDELVPVETAREHARLVPQSELRLYPGGHLLVIRRPEVLAGDLIQFIDNVQSGRAVYRENADAGRQEMASLPFKRDAAWQFSGPAVLVVFLLLALATMVSEDLTCIGTGLLVANGAISFFVGASACFCGILIGDMLLYFAGRSLGRAALARAPIRWFVSAGAVSAAERWFHRRGAVIIILTRFLPGTRTGTYFAAGALKAPFWKFALLFGLASLMWTPLLVGISSQVGDRMIGWYSRFQEWTLPVLLGAGVVIYVMVRFGIPMLSWRGRRLLYSGWLRKVRWEFWPLWFFNAPVFFYVLYLGFVRFRKPILFTAVNPGIPYGGFIGESKSDILSRLEGAGDRIAGWIRLPAGQMLEEREERLREFVDASSGLLPVVLKPDEGQRGLGVHIVRDWKAASELLAQRDVSWIAQQYIEGEEYGVFYYRYPMKSEGGILSITRKKMTSVTGDGRRTLEELILSDPRAVCQAPLHLERWADRLDWIPRDGEAVRLVELGTHCRGSLFLNGEELNSPELLREMDRIAKAFEGFYFGRFDLRAPGDEALMEGKGLRILELNGLTSESTHIYDPRNSVWYAWRVLFGQWRIAFEIAEQNIRMGVKPAKIRQFLDFWRRSLRRQRRMGEAF